MADPAKTPKLAVEAYELEWELECELDRLEPAVDAAASLWLKAPHSNSAPATTKIATTIWMTRSFMLLNLTSAVVCILPFIEFS